MNGIYPSLFNFSCLRTLSINYMQYMKWDLAMLSGTPVLEELACSYGKRLSGSVNSLRVLKETLRSIQFGGCETITGDFMDLEDFPHLECLRLDDTMVTGNVRNLRVHHFPMLRDIRLPKSVYGGMTLERISDAPEIMASLYCLQKRTPELFREYDWTLSDSSPDFYQMNNVPEKRAPFNVTFVTEGACLGWRWTSGGYYAGGWVQHCETHWLDTEPLNGENVNEMDSFQYPQHLGLVLGLGLRAQRYKGFYEPPSEDQYRELVNDYPRMGRFR
mmetsp:Transcript_32971/g.69390  ORF Transcript_32971/g.69390 Transcript_32971/m.69390 type:complete len:274 (+) Transcript_32971:687-1508(+)